MISETEKLDVERAITKAENRTSAEIVAVIARASGGYYYVPYMWGALIALAVRGRLFIGHGCRSRPST